MAGLVYGNNPNVYGYSGYPSGLYQQGLYQPTTPFIQQQPMSAYPYVSQRPFYGGDNDIVINQSMPGGQDDYSASSDSITPTYISPTAKPRRNLPNIQSANIGVGMPGLRQSVYPPQAQSIAIRPDTSFAPSDMNVLMMLASSSQKPQCEQSTWSSGKGWLYALIVIILIIIIVWIIVALCTRNKNRNHNCNTCGESASKCCCKKKVNDCNDETECEPDCEPDCSQVHED